VEELLELKDRLLHGDIPSAIAIVEDLEEMGRKAIVRIIRSYGVVLLVYLIKQDIEDRTTKSGDVSIRNSILEIRSENQRSPGSFYLSSPELRQVLVDAYQRAINQASLEVAGGDYTVRELEQRLDRDKIVDRALDLITNDTL